MPTNETYTKLAQSVDARSKDLTAFIDERGDNITAEDLAEARKIKDDIAGMKLRMKALDEADNLRGFADDASSFVGQPARRHVHQAGNGGAQVLGTTKAGESVFYRQDGSLRKGKGLKLIRESGPRAFGQSQFDAASHPEYRDAYRAHLMGRHTHPHFRLLEEGTDTQGGVLAPADVQARLIMRKPAPTAVSTFCNTINTGRDTVQMPRVNYTGNSADDPDGSIYSTGVRVSMPDENPPSDTSHQVEDSNMFGTVSISVYTFMMSAPLTMNLLEDATFDPLNWMVSVFGDTIDQLKDRVVISGYTNGAVGILSNPGATDTNASVPVITTGTGSTPFITPDSLINMSEDLPTQYDTNGRYLYRRRTTGKTIRTFKDEDGRYLFGQGAQDSGLVPGRNQVLNDYPVSWSDWMPSPASNAYPVVFGDFGGVTIVNRIGFSTSVLREVAARRNQVIVIGRVRFGVSIIEPWRLRVLRCSS